MNFYTPIYCSINNNYRNEKHYLDIPVKYISFRKFISDFWTPTFKVKRTFLYLLSQLKF